MFKEIMIPRAVYREAVIQGIQKEENDAFRIEGVIRDGWLEVRDVKVSYQPKLSIHPGEAEVISLAREMDVRIVLMNDSKARTAAESAGLTPKGTLWLLLKAVHTAKNLSTKKYSPPHGPEAPGPLTVSSRDRKLCPAHSPEKASRADTRTAETPKTPARAACASPL